MILKKDIEDDLREKSEYPLILITPCEIPKSEIRNPFHSFPSSLVLQKYHSLEDNTKKALNLEKAVFKYSPLTLVSFSSC